MVLGEVGLSVAPTSSTKVHGSDCCCGVSIDVLAAALLVGSFDICVNIEIHVRYV